MADQGSGKGGVNMGMLTEVEVELEVPGAKSYIVEGKFSVTWARCEPRTPDPPCYARGFRLFVPTLLPHLPIVF